MKAIKAIDNKALLVDIPEPAGTGVKVKIVSSSICGSDLHMLERGYLVDRTSFVRPSTIWKATKRPDCWRLGRTSK